MLQKLALSFFLFFISSLSFGQSTKPVLILNTEMHTAKISRFDTDAAGKHILTCSKDKTAKLWDANTGRLIRTFRPPIGAGNEGMLYACAISPDGKWVMTGGWSKSKNNDVYIFEANTGLLYHRISGLTNVILDIEFSPNGNYFVVSLGNDSGIRIYRTSTFSLYKSDEDYGGNSNNVSFAQDGRLATVSYDGFIRLYDSYFNLIKKVKTPGSTKPYSLAFTPYGDKLAVGYDDSPQLQVLDGKELNLLYNPSITDADADGDRLEMVAFSSDGSKLLAGGTYSKYIDGSWWCPVRIWDNAGRGTYQDYKGGDDTVMDIKLLPNGQFAYVGAQPDWGILNRSMGYQELYKRAEANNYSSKNISHFRISSDGFEVGITPSQKSALSFSLNEKQIKKVASLHPSPKDEFSTIKVSNWNNSTQPKLNGKTLTFLEKYEFNFAVDVAERSRQLAFGTAWHLYCLDETGKQVWRTTTQSVTWAVNVSGDGRIVAGAFGDGTIRWYRMTDGKLLLTLFMHPDNQRWILWTPSGYYDAAPGAEDLLGWHVNQGADKEALFYPVSRFRYDYYRPDVIDRILETLDEEEALRIANSFANRRSSIRRDITSELPPSVKILSPVSGSPTFTNIVDLEYSIISPNNEPITDIKVLIDGRPSPENRGIRPSGTRGKISVSIPNRSCRVSLLAKNRFGSSEAATIDLQWKGQLELDLYKPNLYILAIGVSEYDDPAYQLNFAAKDASDFVATMQKQEGKLYKKVIPKLLTDGEANRVNILKGLEWLKKETTQHDVAMLFFAGHGIEDNSGTFYFLPREANSESLIYNGIMKEHIKETVKTIIGKVLVFMDACHSGYLMTNTTPKAKGWPEYDSNHQRAARCRKWSRSLFQFYWSTIFARGFSLE